MTRMNRLPRLSRVGRVPIHNRMPRLTSFTTTNRKSIVTRLNRAARVSRTPRLPWMTILIRIWLTRQTSLLRMTWIARAVRRASVTRKTSMSSTTVLHRLNRLTDYKD